MREKDARRWSHETLETLRERAVRHVQEGELGPLGPARASDAEYQDGRA